MKQLSLLLFVILLFSVTGSAAGQTMVDPESGLLIWTDPSVKTIPYADENYGLSEEPGIIHSNPVPSEFQEKGPFPEKYDAREQGLITAVKDQRPYDLCWAESVMSMAESNLIKKGLADQTIDLSEIFAHYFQWFRVPDPLGLTSGDQNKWYPYELYEGYNREWINSWGSGYRAVLLLSGWPGITTEETAPYPDENADITNYTLSPDLAWNASLAKLKDARWISMKDTQAIKRMIMKHGSAVIAFYQNRSKYLNEDTEAYYSPDFLYSNHLVNVIGWDDSYPAGNFRSQPDINGAWLVKNSFGTDWGNEGYFWLSYADKTISADGFIFDFSPIEPGMKTYQYDGTVSYNYINDPNSNTIAAANIFTAVDNEKLVSVGFLSPSSYFSYNIKIYRGVKDTPESGILYAGQSGSELYAGYHTIELETPVDLYSGDRFSVVVEIKAAEKGWAYIMTDRSESYKVTDAKGEERIYQEFISASNPGESFYRLSDGNWIDCWNTDASKSLGNVRIKAYTKFLSFSTTKDIVNGSEGQDDKNPPAPFDLYRLDNTVPSANIPNFSYKSR